jgi:hypothetical protein
MIRRRHRDGISAEDVADEGVPASNALGDPPRTASSGLMGCVTTL